MTSRDILIALGPFLLFVGIMAVGFAFDHYFHIKSSDRTHGDH